jgi:cytochrome P450
MSEFIRYTATIADRHRRDPNSVSELVAAMLDAEEEERLTADELAAMFVQLLFAGHETTTNLLAIGTVELLRNRDQWQLLCDDPSLVRNAVEELLRWVTPVQFVNRNAVTDFELGGVSFQKEQSVFLVLAAANRDPAVFSEPETLDVTRADAGEHLGFGFGFAFCLGTALARLEAEVAFRELTRRFPDAELATDELEWQGFSLLRSLKSVPLRLGRDRG